MVSSNQISAGMIIKLKDKFYRVESSVKVTVPKAPPFMKTQLRDLSSNKLVEKSFKLNLQIEDVTLDTKPLEFLYLEGSNYLFLDTTNLEQVEIPSSIVGDNVNFLKEGTPLKASFYEESVFAVELPQFLELVVSKIEGEEDEAILTNATKTAILETGAKVEVPPFIEVGDIIKIDTGTGEYIQRV